MLRGFGRILVYWRAERRTIAQGFVGMATSSVGSLAAGIALGSITHTLEALPGLIVMVPAAVSLQGSIFGALGSRLGTSIHAGLYAPTREREGVLYQNVAAVVVLTVVVSLLLGVVARTLSVAIGVESISMLDFMVIALVGGVLASLLVLAFTLALARRAYRQGWDLDSVAAPLITAVGDMATVPCLFVATFLLPVPGVTPAVATAGIAVGAFLLFRVLRTDLPLAKRVIRESIAVLVVFGAVDLVAGLFIESRLERFLVFPALLVLLPPFLESAGALGGILSSRLSSKLHLGVLSPRGWPEGVAWLDATIIFLFAFFMFALRGVAAGVAGEVMGLAGPGIVAMVGVSMVGGMIATVLAVALAYYVAIATSRLGLDPDNHGIPIISSTMDLLGVIAFMIGLLALGVGS
jgi:mgtE-like transporter